MVLIILSTIVNPVNYFHIDKAALSTLTKIAQNGGEFPDTSFPESDGGGGMSGGRPGTFPGNRP